MSTAAVQRLEKKAAEEAIESAHEALGLGYGDLAAALGVDRRTVLRYRQHRTIPTPRVRARLEKLRELRHLIGEVFAGPDDGLEWLYSPVELLRGRRPIDLVREGALDEVISVLAGLHTGAHV